MFVKKPHDESTLDTRRPLDRLCAQLKRVVCRRPWTIFLATQKCVCCAYTWGAICASLWPITQSHDFLNIFQWFWAKQHRFCQFKSRSFRWSRRVFLNLCNWNVTMTGDKLRGSPVFRFRGFDVFQLIWKLSQAPSNRLLTGSLHAKSLLGSFGSAQRK